MNHEKRFVLLDFVRGISALLVCAGHLRAAVLQDYVQLQGAGMLDKAFYFLTGLGHQAVVVFFVLSGFFVGGSVLRAGQDFSFPKYAVARLTRLWVVLLPALCITAVVDAVIGTNQPAVLQGAFYSVWSSGPQALTYSSSLITFFGNLFFLQTILSPVFGSNGPLWSLANEFWYYLLFPLIFVAINYVRRTESRQLGGLFAFGVALLLVFYLPRDLVADFAIWLLGVLVYYLSNLIEKKQRPIVLVACSIFFLLTLIYSKNLLWQKSLGLDSDPVVGLGFMVLCLVLANWKSNFQGILGKGMAKLSFAISEFSYSLYLIHFPFVILIASLVWGGKVMRPDLAGLLAYFSVLMLLMLISSLFYYLFERNTGKLRLAISQFLFN